ncbi:MAG TPA: TolC family protein, partial [Blastocatellia bacterium]|nr:TolC family protein [Blastocatellia bacterium]
GERPDVIAALYARKSAEKQLSAAKGEHWPTISAEGNYYLKQNPDSDRDWNVLLTFDLPLFEGGIIEARVRERKALLRSSELNLDLIRRTAVREVRTAYNDFIASAAQVVRLQETVKLTTENYRVQSEDYTRGVVNRLEVLQALQQMHQARRQLQDAQIAAQNQLVRLHVAAGEIEP